jgi:hypothetical protein
MKRKQNEQWLIIGDTYWQSTKGNYTATLPTALLNIGYDDRKGFYLEKMDGKFDFQHKIYGVESELINRVKKTYVNTNRNLGILLNGVKGTGKTVTSKLIANEIGIPVLVVQHAYVGLVDFINSIKQDVIIFIDEYEKIFEERHTLLTIMDGVLSNEYRKFFILTTNETYINDNLLQRPGRIRYFKTFGNLKPNVVNEIVDDFLVHKHLKKDVVRFVSSLELITIDIVKSIVEEVNIHEESPEVFKDIFNCKKITGRYNVYQLTPNPLTSTGFDEAKLFEAVKLNRNDFTAGDDLVGNTFYVDGDYYARIKKVISPKIAILELVKEYDDDEDENDNANAKKEQEIINITVKVESTDVMNYSYKWDPNMMEMMGGAIM